jgi:quercetin dioxygenase-like cupin family protein
LSTAAAAAGEVRVLALSDGVPFSMSTVDSRRLLRPEIGARKLTLNYSVFHQPGFEFPQHVHPRSDDIFLVLQGQADVRQGDSRTPLKTGQAVLIPAGQIHGGIATGKGESILISFQSPPDEGLYTGDRDSSKPGAAKPIGEITPGAVKCADVAGRNGVFFDPEHGSAKMAAAHWKLRPYEKLAIANPADGEQFLFVWKGRLELRSAAKVLQVGQRETALITRQENLEAVNPGPHDATVIQVRAVQEKCDPSDAASVQGFSVQCSGWESPRGQQRSDCGAGFAKPPLPPEL